MGFYIEDFIKTTVDRIRSTGTITSIVKALNVYTINTSSTKNLINGLYVEFNNSNEIYQISNIVTNKSFKVTSQKPIAGAVSWTLSVYFLAGSPDEIKAVLSEKNSSSAFKYKKFPLITLFLPIDEIRDNSEVATTTFNNIVLDFIVESDITLTVEERKEIRFKTVLEPLYDLFFDGLKTSLYTSGLIVPLTKYFNHTKTNFYYYSTEQNVLRAFADAIEVKNLELKFTR